MQKPPLLVCWCILKTALLFAQQGLGLNPPSMKWQYMEVPCGKIIFPKGMDSIAFRTARIMNYERIHDETILGNGRTKAIPVILQPLSVFPAGFSTPAPWRNEYYLTPPQNMFLGPVIWLDGLTAHEYRHTQQFSAAHDGFTIVYRALMGQTGWLFNTLVTQPLWFREGDAVLSETLLTKGGRCRLASFNMEYRAMRMAGYHYSYEKAHYSSFKNFIPNPYRTGYYMVTFARSHFGNDIWQKVLFDTYHRKGFFYPFSRSLESHTGLKVSELYAYTVRELDSTWSIGDKKRVLTSSRMVSDPHTRKYTSYRFPHYLPDGSVLTMKSGLDLINTYYIIDTAGEEHKLFSPGIYTEDHVYTDVEGDKMVWAEAAYDKRWSNKDYSIIKLYNFSKHKTLKLSRKSRYFSPAISRDGEKVAVAETDTMQHYSIVILSAKDGKPIRKLPNAANIFFTQLRWMPDHIHLICIGLKEQGNAILEVNTETGEVRNLLPYTYIPLSCPYPGDSIFYFSADYEGVNNIYALVLKTAKVYRLTRVRFGAFQPVISINGDRLLYSEYTADGYRVKEMQVDSAAWQPENGIAGSGSGENAPYWSKKDSVTYRVKKFNALTNGLFNIYGWFPVPNIPEYGLEFYMQNIMSTLSGTIGLTYNTNELNFKQYTRLSYSAFYPLLDLQYNINNRRSDFIVGKSANNEIYRQSWLERTASAGIRLPLRLTQGTHETNLSAAAYFSYYDVGFQDSTDNWKLIQTQNFTTVKGVLTFKRLKERALQQVKPAWGQTIDFSYEKALITEPLQLTGSLALYFPGFWRTHSFNLRLAYKDEHVVNAYRFTDQFLMPGGYKANAYSKIYYGSVNYEFPLWYPDVALSGLAFFQRVRLNLFYHYGLGILNEEKKYFSSTGPEVFIDFRLFRLFQLTIELRYSYKFTEPAASAQRFEFLVPSFDIAN